MHLHLNLLQATDKNNNKTALLYTYCEEAGGNSSCYNVAGYNRVSILSLQNQCVCECSKGLSMRYIIKYEISELELEKFTRQNIQSPMNIQLSKIDDLSELCLQQLYLSL